MIYDKQGVPLNEVLQRAALNVTERKLHRKSPNYDINVEGNRLYRILHTRLGDAYRVFRRLMADTNSYSGSKLRAARVKTGVGRPSLKPFEVKHLAKIDAALASAKIAFPETYEAAMKEADEIIKSCD